MANSISINPLATTNAAGSFSVHSDGYVQGFALPDPAIRNFLAGGVLSTAETLPMFGGLPVFENIHAASSNGAMGNTVGRATAYANVVGFCVYDQAHAFVSTPQSPAPTAGAGATIPFFRMGSKARIAVEIDPALVSLSGGLITQQVSWDFTNNKIIAFSTTALPVKILDIQIGNSKTVVYDSVNNVATFNNAGSVAIIEI